MKSAVAALIFLGLVAVALGTIVAPAISSYGYYGAPIAAGYAYGSYAPVASYGGLYGAYAAYPATYATTYGLGAYYSGHSLLLKK